MGTLVSSVVYKEAKVGDLVCCSIRPERLAVLAEGQIRSNVLDGEVLRAVYLGNHEQYFLRLQDGTEIKAIEFDTEAPKTERGKTARVGCDPTDVVLVKEFG